MPFRHVLIVLAMVGLLARPTWAAPTEAEMKKAVESYFDDLFGRLGKAAEMAPTEATFREIMRPQVDKVEGHFGSTLINADWEIRQVYFKRDFLAVGFCSFSFNHVSRNRKGGHGVHKFGKADLRLGRNAEHGDERSFEHALGYEL